MLSHSSQTQGGHKNREIVYALPTLNTSLCLAAYIGRKPLSKSYWEVKHNGIDYQAWRHREFVYVGDPVPELNEQEHAAFLMNIHKSILLSLEKRKLLTHSQRERCLVELEKQYSREQKSRRRA